MGIAEKFSRVISYMLSLNAVYFNWNIPELNVWMLLEQSVINLGY